MSSSTLKNALTTFWEQHPALLYGFAALLGCMTGLDHPVVLIIPCIFLWGPLLCVGAHSLKKRLCLAFLVFIAAVAFVETKYDFPQIPEEGLVREAIFDITSLSTSSSHFGTFWVYKGILRELNIPVKISLGDPGDLQRPPADRSYKIRGRLKETSHGVYQFIPDKDAPWHPVLSSWSLAEKRYHAKRAVSHYIYNHVKDARSATFLSGIATGDFDDKLMTYEFGRFGLQHIMAISGFHFAIIAAILGVMLRLLLPKKRASVVLIFLLSSYFLFLGSGPSILRAWISITLALIGYLVDRRGSGLNALGVALLAILVFDPLLLQGIGFQFSFATTAAILLLFSSCDALMQQIFQKRPLSVMTQMDKLNQHGYFLLAMIRQGFALTLAVNSVAMPMTLYYFHKFPWMSLIYNLFFPFLVSVSMLLLIVGTLCDLVFSPLGNLLHAVNSIYTHHMLNFTYNMPTTVDFVWRVDTFPNWLLTLHLTLVLCVGIWLRYCAEQKQQDLQDLAYL